MNDWKGSRGKLGKLLRYEESGGNKEADIPFVFKWYSHVNNSSKILRTYMKYFHADPEVRVVFTPVSFVSFRSACNLWSDLVRSKLYLLERRTGFVIIL